MHRRNTFLYSNAQVYSKEYVFIYISIILHTTSKNHLRLSLTELMLKC